MNKDIIIAILEMIAKYGVTAVIEILKAFKKIEITQEDIEALKELVKDPDSYINPPAEV